MATPHVAAAAALLYSLGVTRPSDVEAALRGSVMPFSPSAPCDAVRCGAGLLDVSKLAAYAPVTDPGAPTSVTAVAGDGRATVSWVPPTQTGGTALVSARAVASPGGQSCTTAGTTCEITGLANGTAYTVSVTVTNAGGRTGPPGVSMSFSPQRAATVPGAVSGFTQSRYTKSGGLYRVTVRWQAPVDDGGAPVMGYLSRYGTGGRWTPWTDRAVMSARITGMRAGTRYVVQVRAVNEMGPGARAAYSLTTPSSRSRADSPFR